MKTLKTSAKLSVADSLRATKNPLISVILPVYNASQFLSQAIESIVKQTYTNWEMIIVDDCSTDDSYKIAKSFAKKDKRIKVLKTKKKVPVGNVANLALKKAKGEYVARMDADDISLPTRFAKQLNFLQQNTKVIGVGGQCQLIDAQNKRTGYKIFPTSSKEIQEMMFYYYPVQSPTFMVRRSALPIDFIWYEEKVESAEEHELLFKLHQYGQVANLPDVTLLYRMHENNVSKKHPKRDFFHIFQVRVKSIFQYGYRPSLAGIIKNLVQVLIISILPEKLIFPAYAFVRKFQSQENPYAK